MARDFYFKIDALKTRCIALFLKLWKDSQSDLPLTTWQEKKGNNDVDNEFNMCTYLISRHEAGVGGTRNRHSYTTAPVTKNIDPGYLPDNIINEEL